MSLRKPIVHIIAGSNGAGKSTFAELFLPRFEKCDEFVNPDLIARGLSPFSPDAARVAAGRVTLNRIAGLCRQRKTFGFESTLSGASHVHIFRRLREQGYRIHIYYLWVRQVSLAVRRVQDRVLAGGHGVPEEDVIRRYQKSLERFVGLYKDLADYTAVFDNSGPVPRLIGTSDAHGWFPVNHRTLEEFLEDAKGD